MSIFDSYLEKLPLAEQKTLRSLIDTVQNQVAGTEEGLGYGLPSIRYKNRPLVGFSSNKHGLNLYPYNPKIITALQDELTNYKTSRGVIRFSPQHPITSELILLIVDLKLESLNK